MYSIGGPKYVWGRTCILGYKPLQYPLRRLEDRIRPVAAWWGPGAVKACWPGSGGRPVQDAEYSPRQAKKQRTHREAGEGRHFMAWPKAL